MSEKRLSIRWTAFYAYAAMALLGAVLTIVNATQGRLADSYGVAENRISLMISCMGVGRLLIQIVCGALSDRFGRKTLVWIGLIGMVGFFFAMPMVHSLAGGMALCVLCGIFYGMVNTTMLALIFDCYSDSGNTQIAQVRVQTVYAVGGIVVPFGASLLLANGMPWKYLYWICGAVTLLMILARQFIHFPPVAVRSAQENGYVHPPRLQREGALLMLTTFCLYGAHTMGLTWMTTLAADGTQMAAADAVRVLSIFSLGALLGSLVIMRLLRRLSNLKVLTWAPVLAMAFFAACTLTRSSGVFRLCALLAGMCTGSLFNLIVGMGGYMFPKSSGTISGMLATASGSASLILPAVTGWMLDVMSVRRMFCTAFALLLLGLAAVLLLRRRDRALRGC